jgi:hypothetical protein
MALSSLATQCQAFKQPIARPATSSASVQEWLPGCAVQPETKRRAEQRRNATDQPISPIMPRPNQTPVRVTCRGRLELARRLRADLLTERGGFGFKGLILGFVSHVKTHHTADETALHFRHHRADALLPFVQVQKLPLHRLAQLAEVRSAMALRTETNTSGPVLTSTPSSTAT